MRPTAPPHLRTERLFAILDRLRARRQPVAAARLAEEFGVSVRTIYRDMVLLQSMGAPVRGEGGVGYQIEKGFFLPPLHFDPDELDAIILGMRLVAVQGDEPLARAAKRAGAKIREVLPEGDRDSYFNAPLLAFSSKRREAQKALRFLSPLRRAVRERRRVKMRYCALNGKVTERVVCPLGLAVFDKVWMLTAWCEDRDDFRNFRADRIESLRTLPSTFPKVPGRELDDYLRTL